MPTLQQYIAAVQDFNYDVIEGLATDEIFINVETTSKEFVWYCYALLSVSQDDMFRFIYDMFTDLNMQENLHVINQIILDTRTNLVVLQKLQIYYPEISNIELLTEWTNFPFSDAVALAIDKIIQVYGIPDYEVLKDILTELESKEQYEFYNFIFAYASEVSDYAPIPKWINQNRTVTEQELQIQNAQLIHPVIEAIPLEQMTDLLYNKLNPWVEDASINSIHTALQNTNPEDRQTINNILNTLNTQENLQEDTNYIPYFGPSNPLQFQGGNIDGQDRMLLCNFYDHDPETGDDIDWFSGACDKCGLRIRQQHHSVRMPIINGGWEGSFCSWECATNYSNDNYSIDSDVINDLIQLYSLQLNEFTLYNR